MKGDPNSHTMGDVRPFLTFGAAVVALLVGGFGAWSATTSISGAIVAPGHVVVDSYVKKVQHPKGGVVHAIFVKDGDKVQAGDLLLELNDTITKANLDAITKQLDEIAVRQAKLKAERDGATQLRFPAQLMERQSKPQVAEIMASELALFESRGKAREAQKAQSAERISQLKEERIGLNAYRKAKSEELAFAREELKGLEQLEIQQLVSTSKITVARRGVAQLEGDLARVVASIAQTSGRIAETNFQILQLDQDLKSEVGKDLRDQQGREAELSERRVAAEDDLSRMSIRAPQSGLVHRLSMHTVGGVVGASEPILMIVPDQDHLVIEASVAPRDIDQISLGQSAQIRFPAFNQRSTPAIAATVTRISADIVGVESSDETQTRAQAHFLVRLEIRPEVISPLDLKLVSGMPAEVYFKTGDRTVASYFMKPVRDQFERAFREE